MSTGGAGRRPPHGDTPWRAPHGSLKKLAIILVALAIAAWIGISQSQLFHHRTLAARAESHLVQAIAHHHSGIEVTGHGVVARILPDDDRGSRHQRFIVRLPAGQTLLIDHNIDVAPRVARLRTGGKITFRGEYVWNPQGGLVHWTHRDVHGHHAGGWLKYDDKVYR